jgi:prostaglandin-endoperoxide synthase 2
MAFEDALIDVAVAILGKSEINEIVTNKLASRGRSRPHPWTTKYDYIGWSGLTDRTYTARLLPADEAFPAADAPGTRLRPQ